MKSQTSPLRVAGLLLAVFTIAGSSFYSDSAHAIERLDCYRIVNQIPFKPFSPARLDNARNRFNQSLKALNSRLGRQGEKIRADWMKFLQGTDLITRDLHDYEEINLFRRWLFSNNEGVEHPAFANTRRDVVPYNDALYTAQYANLYQEHFRHLQELAAACWALNQNPTSENRLAVQTHLTWFSRTETDNGWASTLFAAWRRPNIRLQIPKHFITDKFYAKGAIIREEGPVDESFSLPVGPNGSNKTVRSKGKASTRGDASIHFIPSPETAQFLIKANGRIKSNTQSRFGPIVGDTESVSLFNSQAILEGSIDGIALKSIHSDVHIQSINTEYTSKLPFPLINAWLTQAAEKKAEKPEVKEAVREQNKAAVKSQLEKRVRKQVGEFTTEKDVAKNLQDTIKEQMGSLGDRVTKPFEREGVKVDRTVLGTTLDHVAVKLEVGNSGRLLAMDRGPVNPSDYHVHLAFHQSVLGNMFQVTYAGKWVEDHYFEKVAKLMYAESPYELYTHSRKENWAIKYADINPLTFQFNSKEQIVITVRAAGFKRREPGAKDWKVTLAPSTYVITYRIGEDTHGDPYLEKTNRVASVPSQASLSDEEKAFMGRMEERLNAFLGEDLNMGGITVPKGGPLTALKEIKAYNFKISNGWISANVSNLAKILEEWAPE